MSDQPPTQPGPPPGWGQPPPDQTQPWTQPPPPTPPRPWFKRGWFLLLVGFIVGGIIGAAGAGGTDPQATRNAVERKVFTENCAELDAAERQRCEATARRHDLELTRAEVRGRQEAREESVSTTSTPKPQETTAPAPVSFGDGQYAVPQQVKPGTYATQGGENCYWARLKGFSGNLEDIAANGNPTGPARVTIARTDKGFETQGCGEWQKVG
jgi:hypothetical protein